MNQNKETFNRMSLKSPGQLQHRGENNLQRTQRGCTGLCSPHVLLQHKSNLLVEQVFSDLYPAAFQLGLKNFDLQCKNPLLTPFQGSKSWYKEVTETPSPLHPGQRCDFCIAAAVDSDMGCLFLWLYLCCSCSSLSSTHWVCTHRHRHLSLVPYWGQRLHQCCSPSLALWGTDQRPDMLPS